MSRIPLVERERERERERETFFGCLNLLELYKRICSFFLPLGAFFLKSLAGFHPPGAHVLTSDLV